MIFVWLAVMLYFPLGIVFLAWFRGAIRGQRNSNMTDAEATGTLLFWPLVAGLMIVAAFWFFLLGMAEGLDASFRKRFPKSR